MKGNASAALSLTSGDGRAMTASVCPHSDSHNEERSAGTESRNKHYLQEPEGVPFCDAVLHRLECWKLFRTLGSVDVIGHDHACRKPGKCYHHQHRQCHRQALEQLLLTVGDFRYNGCHLLAHCSSSLCEMSHRLSTVDTSVAMEMQCMSEEIGTEWGTD